ncbi:MAG TPA: FumA C-terminus/TtdB family hydratase beta subunit [Candidatus Omnitrophota bacterium]|nr:FumA C-terminus/TtdB family hydratase beta subunit [Candidatus Omnitrophota bacterium]HPT07320.1 FumA C-terminus/TtdB family hydratase beta subunit [Candidatus Omnitrophota bacterium]
MKILNTPLTKKQIQSLKAGDRVIVNGSIFTARDQAHKRFTQALAARRKLPICVKSEILYYCGPTKTPRGKIIGSCGPTTSARMDAFTPAMLKAGLRGMIGKGKRGAAVIEAIKKYKAVYFLTYAGCGALMTKFIKEADRVAYPDLGPEAVYRLRVEKFPLIVAIDSTGRNIYD